MGDVDWRAVGSTAQVDAGGFALPSTEAVERIVRPRRQRGVELNVSQ